MALNALALAFAWPWGCVYGLALALNALALALALNALALALNALALALNALALALYSVALLTSLVQSCGTEDAKVLYCYIIIIIINIIFIFTPILDSQGIEKNYAMQYKKSTKIKLE